MAIGTPSFVWIDGEFIKWNGAKVHIMTHALHYGSAIFEGLHTYKTEHGTVIFRLDGHIDRFFHSGNALSMKINFSKKQLRNAIIKLVKINKIGDGYIRPLAYYGYGNVGIFPKGIETNVALITIPWGHYYTKELHIMTSKFRRHSESSTIFGTKLSGNYVNSILAMHEARKKGYDEALMLDYRGYVSEGPAENLFLVKNECLITPSSRSALHGITRNSIMKLSRDMGIKVYEKNVTLKNVKNADELFFCGTATEVAPIVEVDKRKIGNGKAGEITLKIKQKYNDIVRGKDKKYHTWLTFVK